MRYIEQKIDPDDLKTITMVLPNGQKKKVIVYLDETGEQYLKMLMQHREISLPDKAKHVSLMTEMVEIGQELHKLNPMIEDLKKDQSAKAKDQLKTAMQQRKALALKGVEIPKVVKKLVTEAYGLFRRLLHGDSQIQWDRVVEETHNSATYTTLKGETKAGPLDRDFNSLKLCIGKHKLTVFTHDAADQMHFYLGTVIKKPQQVCIHAFMRRFQTLNRYLPFLPCKKESPHAGTETVARNVSYTAAEQCAILLRCIPTSWYNQWNLTNVTMVEKPDVLRVQLEAIEKVMDQKRLEEKSKQPSANSEKKEGAKKRSNSGSNDTIHVPRKKQKTANGRGCERCEKYGGNGAGHNTNECRHWNADGMVNPVWNKKSGGKKTNTKRGGGGKKSVSYLTSKVKKQDKKLKKLTKRLKSRKGKGKHKRCPSSESDSSTSSSDDSK